MSRIARALIQLVFRRIRSGTLVVVEDGKRRRFGEGGPQALVTVNSPRVWPRLLGGSLGLADSYADGLWDSPDLVALIRLVARNAATGDRIRTWFLPLTRHARSLTRPSTRRRRRRDIAAHYDLGEELFRRMLDPTLSYSCAVFAQSSMTLEEAQLAKLELVCEKLGLSPEDRVLEIGTGWGAFALHAASSRGCHVTTTTISADQHAYVTELVRAAGLSDRVTVLCDDFRDLRGCYDKLVSIEMIEAVGWRHTGAFLGTCSRLLRSDGAMLLQAITIDDGLYEIEKGGRSFIKRRIFPGGSLPSIAALGRDLASHTDMQLLALDDITHHYVDTLRAWRERFAAHRAQLAERGYGERFQRLWALYLAYCQAGFAERRIGDVQLLLGKPECSLRPLDRGSDPLRGLSRTAPIGPGGSPVCDSTEEQYA